MGWSLEEKTYVVKCCFVVCFLNGHIQTREKRTKQKHNWLHMAPGHRSQKQDCPGKTQIGGNPKQRDVMKRAWTRSSNRENSSYTLGKPCVTTSAIKLIIKFVNHPHWRLSKLCTPIYQRWVRRKLKSMLS